MRVKGNFGVGCIQILGFFYLSACDRYFMETIDTSHAAGVSLAFWRVTGLGSMSCFCWPFFFRCWCFLPAFGKWVWQRRRVVHSLERTKGVVWEFLFFVPSIWLQLLRGVWIYCSRSQYERQFGNNTRHRQFGQRLGGCLGGIQSFWVKASIHSLYTGQLI